MNINFELKSNLESRGFIIANENSMRMEFAMGSIANYTKCTITLEHRIWGELANDWFYWVRYESFSESGHPEVDHHIITERYIAESNVIDFMKDKGLYTKAERRERLEGLRKKQRD